MAEFNAFINGTAEYFALLFGLQHLYTAFLRPTTFTGGFFFWNIQRFRHSCPDLRIK
jgi:hypothetical protein